MSLGVLGTGILALNNSYAAVVNCDGAQVERTSPSKTRFLERKLEKAYKRVVCECDRQDPSCRNASLNERVRETQAAHLGLLLSEILADPQSDQDVVEETENYLNAVSKQWIVVVINVNNIFAFKRGSTRKERKCVVSRMTEEVIEINRRTDEKFAECPCPDDGKRKSRRGRSCEESE